MYLIFLDNFDNSYKISSYQKNSLPIHNFSVNRNYITNLISSYQRTYKFSGYFTIFNYEITIFYIKI